MVDYELELLDRIYLYLSLDKLSLLSQLKGEFFGAKVLLHNVRKVKLVVFSFHGYYHLVTFEPFASLDVVVEQPMDGQTWKHSLHL